MFNFNNLKQALTKNSIIETKGFIPFLTASKIVVNFKAADSGLFITIAFGIRPAISVEMKTIIKNNVRSKNLVLRELSCQKSLASPLPSQPIAISEIVTPNCDEINDDLNLF